MCKSNFRNTLSGALAAIYVAAIMANVRCVAQPEGGASENKVVENYIFSARTEEKAYRPGEKIAVILSMKNVGKEVALPGTPAFLAVSDFKVTLTNGVIVPLTLFGKQWFQPLNQSRRSGYDYIFGIRPGEEKSQTFDHLNRLYDMTLEGSYRITAFIRVPKRDGTKGDALVTSNTVEIVIDENAGLVNSTSDSRRDSKEKMDLVVE
jgi:hypothetical protein